MFLVHVTISDIFCSTFTFSRIFPHLLTSSHIFRPTDTVESTPAGGGLFLLNHQNIRSSFRPALPTMTDPFYIHNSIPPLIPLRPARDQHILSDRLWPYSRPLHGTCHVQQLILCFRAFDLRYRPPFRLWARRRLSSQIFLPLVGPDAPTKLSPNVDSRPWTKLLLH